MTEQKLTAFKKMIDSPDFSIIKNVYFSISLKAFKECFTNITRFDKYFNNVFESLVQIVQKMECYKDVPKNEIEKGINVGAMILLAENILRQNDTCGFGDNTALFIIEKLFAEPLVILGKELYTDTK